MDIRGRGLYLSFDVETKDLLEYKAQKAGKKITFAKRDLQEYREKYNY